MEGIKAYSAEKIFTGEDWVSDHAVVVEKDRILDLVPIAHLPADILHDRFSGKFIASAFIDLQIYGANGKLLAAYPEMESLKDLKDYCYGGGAAYCMPTVATNRKPTVLQSIDAVRNYWKHQGLGILGIHLEGPWLNPVKRGAHLESEIHQPEIEEVKALLDYGRDIIKIITLAPEVCSQEVVDLILSRGILISAGHSNATYAEGIHAFQSGITLVTHLYNAMSPLQHRAPGLVGAAMDHEFAMASIIPDGHHVDYAAIRIAKQAMKKRMFVITDAVTPTDIGDYHHQLEGDKYTSDGILSGSALTMVKAVHNLVVYTGTAIEEALRMCSLYPARALKADGHLGLVAKGYDSKMVVIDESLEKAQVIG